MRTMAKEMAGLKQGKPKPRSYDICDLARDVYGRYLNNYQPRKVKQKRKSSKRERIGPFELMKPYTITIMGYLNTEVDIEWLYEALRDETLRDVQTEEQAKKPGNILKVVSGDYREKLPGLPERITETCLTNHTSILMQLDGPLVVQIRMSSQKIEVIGCKKDEDLDCAWFHLARHMTGFSVEVQKDPLIPIEIVSKYGAMRNYTLDLGFSLNLSDLEDQIASLGTQTEFTASRAPSLQSDLRICHPVKTKPNTPTKKKGTDLSKEHVFKVYHTGSCLYSGKGPLEECKDVFEKFRALIDLLRPEVRLLHEPAETRKE